MSKLDPKTSALVARVTNGRDIPSRVAAAQKIQTDAKTIARLVYSLTRCRQMAENASYRVGRPGRAPDLAAIQLGFNDIAKEAIEALHESQDGGEDESTPRFMGAPFGESY